MARDVRLSWITVGFGSYIVVSAAFMLQLTVWLTGLIGKTLLWGCFWAVSLFVMVAAVLYAVRARLGIIRLYAVICAFIMALLLAVNQRYFGEKSHVLMYGLLGYLAIRDLADADRTTNPTLMALAMAFIAIISACDEVFQWILPYRFGDIKDFITNVVSGMFGITLFVSLRKDGPE